MNELLLGLALRSVILVLASGVAVLLLRKTSASVRNAVWRLAFVGLLLLPLLFLRLPRWDVPVQPAPAVGAVIRTLDYTETAPSKAIAPAPRPIERPRVNWLPVASVLASGFALVSLLAGWLALALVLRRSRPAEDTTLEALCRELGIRRQVSLLYSKQVGTPATSGHFKPVILLPEAAEAWSAERMEMVLRHELAHIQRGDWLSNLFAQLACVLYAPNPLVWIARAHLRAESETACDDMVVAGGVDANFYASELLHIARGIRPTSLFAATVGMAHRPIVESRLRAIIDPMRRRGAASRKAIISLTICGLVAAGFVGSVRLVSAQVNKEGTKDPLSTLITKKQAQDRLRAMLEKLRDANREDVSDHPDVPPIAPGAKFTTDSYEPPADHVTVAEEGVAHLSNGVTVTLEGIGIASRNGPEAASTPVWNLADHDVTGVQMNRWLPTAGYGDGSDSPVLSRNILFAVQSAEQAKASTMGYMFKPTPPSSYKLHGVVYAGYGRDEPHNTFALGPDSMYSIQLWIPGHPSLDRATYRFGVATGEWKSVLDFPNPYRGAANGETGAGGGLTLEGIPCLIGPRTPEQNRQPNDRFAGLVNASHLVARRALILDGDGNLIRGEGSDSVGWYPLSQSDIRRCTHIVIQEREMEWAEFRDIPLRPHLDSN